MTTPEQFAEACERAADDCGYCLYCDAQCVFCKEPRQRAATLRALAAAMRKGTAVSSLDGTRIVNLVITLPDA